MLQKCFTMGGILLELISEQFNVHAFQSSLCCAAQCSRLTGKDTQDTQDTQGKDTKEPKIKKLKMGFDWMAGFPPQLESHEVGNKPPWLKSSSATSHFQLCLHTGSHWLHLPGSYMYV